MTFNKLNNTGENMKDEQERTYLPPEEWEKIKKILVDLDCHKEKETKDEKEKNVNEGE